MSKIKDVQVIDASFAVTESATGGGLEGASRTSRETALWNPNMGSPNRIINSVKAVADARGRDLALNDGWIQGAIGTRKDSIVGGHYRLNATPVLRVLQTYSKSFDTVWEEEFQQTVEAIFDLIAESEECYLDASGTNTLTEMARLAVAGDMLTGEIFASAEWLSRDRTRPVATALQMISPSRVCNPPWLVESRTLRRGVQLDSRGKPLGYWVRVALPGDGFYGEDFEWKYIPAKKPWGRRQMIHLFEQMEPGQARGIAEIVSVLKNHRMTKQFDELTLQSAVVDASYASAIESELPPDAVYGMMGGADGAENFENAVGSFMGILQSYFGAANNVAIDGVRIPVLPPGTKMVAQKLGSPNGLGSDFGKSLLRHTAAGLGQSAEEFMNNFSDTSYSGLRGAFAFTEKKMKARKKRTADRFCGGAYTLTLEELVGDRRVPLPRGISREFFYEPLMKEALCKSAWIGAGSGQIDELKETQAAILRVKSGLSTYEVEIAKLGRDYREVFSQRAREEGIIKGHGLAFSLDTQKQGNKEPQNTLSDDPDSGTQNNNASEEDEL